MKRTTSRSPITDAQQSTRSRDPQPAQLELDGFGTIHPLLAAGHVDPRFILSDETCRIGRKYLAEMRRILTASAERPAA
ncbi:MAG: hypothetical protein ACKOI2_10885 [Actinomycetota bacterium]